MSGAPKTTPAETRRFRSRSTGLVFAARWIGDAQLPEGGAWLVDEAEACVPPAEAEEDWEPTDGE